MMDRRLFVGTGLAGLTLSALYPGMALARPSTNQRFVFLIQRGAADGLATVIPAGDPDFLRQRASAAKRLTAGHRLNSFFTLHEKLPETAKLYARKQASFVHAVASSYRERSHFDAQNILESGAAQPYARKDGWLNRLLSLLPAEQSRAIAIAPSLPLALRGPNPASSFEQSRLGGPSDTAMRRVEMLYAEDPQLSALWEDAVETDRMVGRAKGRLRGGTAAGMAAAGLLKGANGARVMMLESSGWDTHSGQFGRLNGRLRELDEFVASLSSNLGDIWRDTLLIVATEFGRTVAFNGTQGTDHGTASAAMMFGGSLKNGGRVMADWPGLAKADLYEGRDLRPTIAFEDMISDALAHHYDLNKAKVKSRLFPDLV